MPASVKLPTEKRFGLTFAVIFAAVGAYGVLKAWSASVYGTWFFTSAALGLISVTAPRILAPFNRAWFRLGELLGRIVSPIVLGLIFFGLLTPVSIIARLLGRDELRLKRRTVGSYWLARDTSVPAPDSFKQQF